MGKKIILALGIIITFISLNVFSRYLYAQSWFGTTKFSKDVDPFDIITLVVTTIVTIWFGWYVSKKLTEKRFEKDYIISDLKQIEDEINYLSRNIETNKIELQTMLNLLAKLNLYIQRFSKTIEIFKISCIDPKRLHKFYSTLYTKTTDLGGSELELNEVNRNEINQVCADFVITTREMIFSVNQH